MLSRATSASTISTINTLIVDDEQLARNELIYLLKDFTEVDVVGTGENGLEAVSLIESLEPDLVFLDVQMPGLDGLGVIRKLRDTGVPLPYFVLATAFDHYAIEAFRLEAMDYLLKPIDKERLAETMQRAQRFLQERAKTVSPTEPVLQSKSSLQRSKILVKNAGRSFIVDAQDIVYATIDDGLITIVTNTMEGESNYRTIEELQSNLDSDTFWRVHRSYLVNIHRIREVIPWFKSSYQIRMDDKKQTEIPVSRVQTKRLRTLLKL
jgi:two-component system LytT family response regulator/two-component system response regulator LytT